MHQSPPHFPLPNGNSLLHGKCSPKKKSSQSSLDCLGAGKGVRGVSFAAGAWQATRESRDLTSPASAATAATRTCQQGWGWCLCKNDKSEKRFDLTFHAKLSPSPKATQLLTSMCKGIFRHEVLVIAKATLQIFLPGFIFTLAGFCTFSCRERHSP